MGMFDVFKRSEPATPVRRHSSAFAAQEKAYAAKTAESLMRRQVIENVGLAELVPDAATAAARRNVKSRVSALTSSLDVVTAPAQQAPASSPSTTNHDHGGPSL